MDELVPSEFYLSQIYPNPFTEKTTIKYCVPDKSLIKLTVIDSNMNIFEELENEVKEAGTYEIEFVTSSITVGTYYYSLEAKGFNKTIEMVLKK